MIQRAKVYVTQTKVIDGGNGTVEDKNYVIEIADSSNVFYGSNLSSNHTVGVLVIKPLLNIGNLYLDFSNVNAVSAFTSKVCEPLTLADEVKEYLKTVKIAHDLRNTGDLHFVVNSIEEPGTTKGMINGWLSIDYDTGDIEVSLMAFNALESNRNFTVSIPLFFENKEV